jgi:hypothetical protein
MFLEQGDGMITESRLEIVQFARGGIVGAKFKGAGFPLSRHSGSESERGGQEEKTEFHKLANNNVAVMALRKQGAVKEKRAN